MGAAKLQWQPHVSVVLTLGGARVALTLGGARVSAELDGTSSEDGELDVTSGDKGELDGTSGELGVSLLRAGTGGRSGLESAATRFRLGIGDSPDTG